jgi:putative transposase
VQEHSVRYSVVTLCRVLGVSRSGYYSWHDRLPSERQRANEQLVQRIAQIHQQSRLVYGSPRILKALRQEGIWCNRKRIVRLMQLHHIRAKTKRRFKVTTHTDQRLPVANDLVQQNFAVSAPNRVWTSDITYLWTREGWVYLAVILDLYARRIVGWELSSRLTADLVTSALQRAVDVRQPKPGLILHSDRGSQFASQELHILVERYTIRQSMSATGNCYDNAVTESFFHTLKTEHAFFEHYETRQEARSSVFEYIEAFYNRQRLHSTIGYMSPSQFEELYFST